MATPKMHRDKKGLNAPYYLVLLKFDPLICMYVLSRMIVYRESLSSFYS